MNSKFDTLFEIISDSSLDMPQELLETHHIHVVPFQISFDEKTYEKEIVEISSREVYERMVQQPDVFPKTSMPSVMDYYEVMEKLAEAGRDILCICMTKKFTSSMQSALNAREMVLEKYPDISIEVMDSTHATALQGLFVMEAVSLRDEKKNLQEAKVRLEEIRGTGNIIFSVGSMDYLIHGGRVGKMTGKVATTLNLQPMVAMKEGELHSLGVARTREQAKKKVMQLFCKYVEEQQIDLNNYRVATGYGYDAAEGAAFHQDAKALLKKKYGYDAKDFYSYQIGATIGVHTGPYPIGIGLIERA